MTATGREIRSRILDVSDEALGFEGKTTSVGSQTYTLRDNLRFAMNTMSLDDVSGAFLRVTQALTGTATATGATSLTNSGAPFPGSNGLTGALVVAYTAPGVTTVLTITSDTTTVLTGTAGWSNGTPASTSTYYVTYGHVAKINYPDHADGDLTYDPAATTAIATATRYELWYHGIWPDFVDKAKDRALTTRCSRARAKPMSVLPDVEDWPVAAYSATAGGTTDAAGVTSALDFPDEIFARGMTVTNSGAAGILSSKVLKVQPTEQYRVFGRVSVSAQTASVRVRDLTNSADITLTGDSTFTLNGWQWFDITFTIPSGCGTIQLWLGGASASCVALWTGIGMLPTNETLLSLNSRVGSSHHVGRVYQYMLPTTVGGSLYRREIQVNRETAGDGAVVLGDEPPGRWPCYYIERHSYTVLQTDYFSKVDRATGDGTSTDCPIDYIAWATIVELLEARKRTDDLDRLLLVATKNLRVFDRTYGMDPFVAPQFPRSNYSGIPSLAL